MQSYYNMMINYWHKKRVPFWTPSFHLNPIANYKTFFIQNRFKAFIRSSGNVEQGLLLF